MKKIIKICTLALVAAAFTVNSFGQATATANAGAVIITPISIAKTADLHFGTIMKGTLASDILLTPGNVRSVASGNATLSAIAPVSAVASFTVTGEGALTYAITLPANGVVTITGPGAPMAIKDFASNPSGTGALTAGTQTLTVGGTLVVGASQVSGTYTGTFDVSVNYN